MLETQLGGIKWLQQAAEIFKKLGAKRDLEIAETKLSAGA